MKNFCFLFLLFVSANFYSVQCQQTIPAGLSINESFKDCWDNVQFFCYKDRFGATKRIEIDYKLVSEYEMAPPLSRTMGWANEYISFYEFGNGAYIKFKAMIYVLSSPSNSMLNGYVKLNTANRHFGYTYTDNAATHLYPTKEVYFKLKDTAGSTKSNAFYDNLREYRGVEIGGGLVKLSDLGQVFDFCEKMYQLGYVDYCYPRFSTIAEAYRLPDPPDGYIYAIAPNVFYEDRVLTHFTYDASGNMTGRTIRWNNGLQSARGKQSARSSVDSTFSEEDITLVESSDNTATNPHIQEDQAGDLRFSIYPNPTVGLLTVEVNDAIPEENPAMIYVYDFNGKLVKQQPIKSNTNQIDITNERSGVYILRIQHKDAMVDWKIIKN